MTQTPPKTDKNRCRAYLRQTGRRALTPQQERRANKKVRQAERRERELYGDQENSYRYGSA